MSKQPEISRLIAKAFQDAEWQLLCSHKEFAEAVRKAKTIDDAQHLMMAGEKILNPPPQFNCKSPPDNSSSTRASNHPVNFS